MGKVRALVLDGALGSCLIGIVESDGESVRCAAFDEHFDLPLLMRIASLLPTADDRACVTEVIVGSGPGNYSGIRAAAAAATGIAAALHVPLRESPSDQSLARAAGRSFSIALGARESLEVRAGNTTIVAHESASAPLAHLDLSDAALCALVHGAGAPIAHVTLRYPAPARGSEAR